MTSKKKPNLRISNFPWEMGELEIQRTAEYFDQMIEYARVAKKFFVASQFSAPAELIFSMLKEYLIFTINFFQWEHRDIWTRNPELQIFYAPTKFHGVEGTVKLDTGLPSHRNKGRKSQLLPPSEEIVEFFGNLYEEILQLETSYLHYSKVPRKFLTKVRNCSIVPSGTELQVQVHSAEKRVKALLAQVAYLRRQLKKVAFRRSSRKKPSHSPK